MKSGPLTLVLLALAAFSPAQALEASPIDKILQMIGDLQAKVIGEGEEAQKAYDEHAEWCEDRSKSLGFEIKTGQTEVAELKATIDQESSAAAALETKIEDLSADIQQDEADLAA